MHQLTAPGRFGCGLTQIWLARFGPVEEYYTSPPLTNQSSRPRGRCAPFTHLMSYSATHPNYCNLEVLTYQSGILRLVEPDLKHAESSLSWTADPSVVQYMGIEFDQPSKAKEIKRITEIRNNPDEYNWMIELDGKTIGNVSINSIEETSLKLGKKAGNYTILIGDKDHWGKGIAKHIGLSVLNWAFSKGGFEAMAARALNENTASIKMLKKLGFEYLDKTPYERTIAGKPTEWQNFKITKQDFELLKAN
jgi:[ribosomal protein S5]-alanine N-acetyltransferase